MSSDGYLFADQDLSEVLRRQDQAMFDEIAAIEGPRLLSLSVDKLSEYCEQKYRIEMPRLKEDGIQVDHQEVKVDVSRDSFRVISDRSRPFHIAGTEVVFHVPVEGDLQVLRYRPGSVMLNPPRGMIWEGEIRCSFMVTEHDPTNVKSTFDRNMAQVRQYLKCSEEAVSSFNSSLGVKARQRIEARRQKLLNDQGFAAAMGFPLRRRDDAPNTFRVPTVRRKVYTAPPRLTQTSAMPEPVIGMEEYEQILSVIRNMVDVMERSPRAFKGLVEEDLRNHFLVQLNGQYEGQATGETFNFDGKTDILIRVGGKNIFIAECKFWRGPDSLREAVDQLLGYVSWRDTKTALLIFNRNKELSRVLKGVPDVVKVHPSFKRSIPYEKETDFRFVLSHRDDADRELMLTVLVFEVPV